ncbi:MAG TPA: hypothetical protein VM901_01560 [Bdellovibrionota bacterium]|jgi:hypothetical protein|nr:hypothetical protein [Bdellovibrionota bacterium]
MSKKFSQQRPQKPTQGQGGSGISQESQNPEAEEFINDEDLISRSKSERTWSDDQDNRQKNTDT